MEIYCKSCSGSRVGITAKDYSDASDFDKLAAHVVLFHVDDGAARCVQKKVPELMVHPGARVLCFKGTMLAGLTGPTDCDLRRTLCKQYPGRIHFLSFAVPETPSSAGLLDRFLNFAASVRESDDEVDWRILDPEWDENLLAVYLAMRALATAAEGALLARALADCSRFERILGKAQREYRLLGEPHTSRGLITPETAKLVADRIWQVFESRKA